jgi:hypothetical protein
MEFKDQVKLDKNCLDDNAIEQPTLYAEWSEKWAKAVLIRDKAKERVSTIIAEASTDIRNHPEQYSWENDKAPTESFINSQIPIHPEVKKSQEELIEAQYQVNLLSSAKETLGQRNDALAALTRLYTGGYFSAKSNPELKAQAQEKISTVQREGLTSPRLKRKV